MARPQRILPEPAAMIVAPQPEPVDVGATVLRAGGNALDATIAAALVQGVVDPLMCGLGGFALLQLAAPSTEPVVYDGLGRVPGSATPDLWADRVLGETSDGFGFIVRDFVNESGPTSVLVPGTLRTLADAHATHGRLPWDDLVRPAIALARAGWLVRPHVATVFTQDERRYGRMDFAEKLALTPDGRRLYLRDDGTPKRLGERVVNPELAEVLDLVARDPRALYEGELAGVVADAVARDGGLLSASDLRSFRTQQCASLRGEYRGWGVGVPAPPGGGTYLLQALALLERLLPAGVTHNGPDHLRLLAEVMKTALRDKDRYAGDPDFRADPVPGDAGEAPADLLDPGRLDALADDIRAGRRVRIERLPAGDSRHTTHVSAVDADGMTVALTHTLGNPSGYIPPGTGFMLNGGMSTFDPRPGRANSLAPGKRRLSTMSPTLLFDADDSTRPVGTLGAPGASWIGPGILQVVSNLLDWGMDTQEAVAAPRIAATSDAIDISNRIPAAVEDALIADGYEIRRSPLSYAFAGVHAITAFDGRLRGGADPQRDGYAAGVPADELP